MKKISVLAILLCLAVSLSVFASCDFGASGNVAGTENSTSDHKTEESEKATDVDKTTASEKFEESDRPTDSEKQTAVGESKETDKPNDLEKQTTAGESNENEKPTESEKSTESETEVYPEASVGLVFTSNGDGTCYVSGIGVCADTDIVIPYVSPHGDRVTSIGDYAFSHCYSLISIDIPDSVTSIGKAAFIHCYSLMSVKIGNGVTNIGDNAFSYCNGLKSVYITDIAKWCAIEFGNIYANPIKNAHNLYLNEELVTELVIPEGLTKIKSYTFCGCTSLTSVVIPDSVTSIGEDAFSNSLKLVEIYNLSDLIITAGSSSDGSVARYAKNVYTDTSVESKLNKKDGYIFYCDDEKSSYYLMGYAGKDTDLILPNGINGHAYEIYNYAFRNYINLTGIEIPDSVTSIGRSAFNECSNLTSVIIGNGVTSIGDYAFYGCGSLTTMEIGDSVTSIGGYAFDGCTNIIIVEENGVSYVDKWVIDYNNGIVTEVVLREDTVGIADDAFRESGRLTSVVIPDSVTSIGEDAFLSSKNLTSVILGNGVTSIGDYAFESCNKLTSLVLGNGVTSIGKFAFYDCSSLTSIEMPNSVMSIGKYAFGECSSLSSVNYMGSEEDWTKISIGSFNSPLSSATINYNYKAD